jgi:hypothetical protein
MIRVAEVVLYMGLSDFVSGVVGAIGNSFVKKWDSIHLQVTSFHGVLFF